MEPTTIVPPTTVPAKMPGVIELIKQSIAFYKKNYKILISIGFVVFVWGILSQVVRVMSIGIHTFTPVVAIILVILSIIFGIGGGILQVFMQISFIKTVRDCDVGVPKDIKDTYKDSLKMFWSYVWISILTMVVTAGSAIFFIIPAIILTGYLTYSMVFYILDGKKGMNALLTSFYYIENNWWPVLWRSIGFGLLWALILAGVVIVGLILLFLSGISMETLKLTFAIPTVSILWSSIAGFISACIFMPVAYSYSYLIYKFLKQQKPEPNLDDPELKSRRKLFIGLGIFGILVILALFVLPIVLGITSALKRGVPPAQTIQTSAVINSLVSFYK